MVCVLGDAVHNLRSALDHLAVAVAKQNSVKKKLLRKTAFTIGENATEFETAISDEKVTRIGRAWGEFLKAVQPYAGGLGADFFVIAALDNIDKHRALLVVEALGDTYRWIEQTSTYVPIKRGASFKKGITIVLDPNDPDYHTHSRTRVVIREKVRGHNPEDWANTVLRQLSASVRQLVDAAEARTDLWPA